MKSSERKHTNQTGILKVFLSFMRFIKLTIFKILYFYKVYLFFFNSSNYNYTQSNPKKSTISFSLFFALFKVLDFPFKSSKGFF